jgi:hypothetical protein
MTAGGRSTEGTRKGTEGVSVPADQVRLGWGFYPLIGRGTLAMADESLSFEIALGATKVRTTLVRVDLNNILEVDTEKWPHLIVGLVLWFFIPWSWFTFDRLANLNLYTGTQGLHFRVDNPEELAGLVRSKAVAS